MVQFLSINCFSWISSIFVAFFKSSRFFCIILYLLTSLLLEMLRIYDIDSFIAVSVHTLIFRHEVLPLSSFYLRSSVISIDPFFMSTYAVDLALDPIHC